MRRQLTQLWTSINSHRERDSMNSSNPQGYKRMVQNHFDGIKEHGERGEHGLNGQGAPNSYIFHDPQLVVAHLVWCQIFLLARYSGTDQERMLRFDKNATGNNPSPL